MQRDRTADAFVGDFSEPAFNEIAPRAASGDEMAVEAGMTREPTLDPRVFVRCVVVKAVPMAATWTTGCWPRGNCGSNSAMRSRSFLERGGSSKRRGPSSSDSMQIGGGGTRFCASVAYGRVKHDPPLGSRRNWVPIIIRDTQTAAGGYWLMKTGTSRCFLLVRERGVNLARRIRVQIDLAALLAYVCPQTAHEQEAALPLCL